jgi:hypothetical protein
MERLSVNLPASARVPALSANKVASVLPRDRVATALTEGELGVTAAVSPPRVEVTVVGTLSARSACTLGESGVSIINLLGEEVEGSGHDSSSSHQGAEEGLQRDHIDEDQS